MNDETKRSHSIFAANTLGTHNVPAHTYIQRKPGHVVIRYDKN